MTVHYGTHNAVTQTACEQYTWHGTTYTQSGTYTYSYTNATGCASVDTLHLTVHYGTHNAVTQTTCEQYTWHGTTYTQSGTYTYSYTNATGCASVDTLHLTVHYGTHNAVTQTACESYVWHGTTYTQSGTYTCSYTNATGCASVDTLHLTISPLPMVTISGNTVICEGMTSQLTATGGTTYVWNTGSVQPTITVSQSGIYQVTVTNAQGCTKSESVQVTVNPLPQIDILGNTTFCENGSTVLTANGASTYVWSTGETTPSIIVNAFGSYGVTGTSSQGCVNTASVVALVSPLPTITIVGDTNVCGMDSAILVVQGGTSYVWSDGNTDSVRVVFGNGLYQVMGFSDMGCQNMARVTVHFWDTDTSEVTMSVPDSCYYWNDIQYCQSGDYVQILQNQNGCDSVVTLHLTLRVGVTSHNENYSFNVYPNPTKDMITIELQTPNSVRNSAVLYDAMGKRVRAVQWEGEQSVQQMDVSDLSTGLYILKLYSDNHFNGVVKIVKQ